MKKIRLKDDKKKGNVSDLFNTILQKHAMIKKKIDILHKVDNLFFGDTDTRKQTCLCNQN